MVPPLKPLIQPKGPRFGLEQGSWVYVKQTPDASLAIAVIMSLVPSPSAKAFVTTPTSKGAVQSLILVSTTLSHSVTAI